MFPNIESLVDALYEWEAMKDEDIQTDDEDEDMNNTANQASSESNSEHDDQLAAQQFEHKQTTKTRRQTNAKQDNKPDAPQALNLDTLLEGNSTDVAKLLDEITRMKDQRMCKVCMDNEISIVFLKCGHICTCMDCAPAMKHCPMCREPIRGTIRVFLS